MDIQKIIYWLILIAFWIFIGAIGYLLICYYQLVILGIGIILTFKFVQKVSDGCNDSDDDF
ncbi:hypothetical protein EDM00_07300 [Ornithobacterium rhinotracheale]|nr:hypothetical protein [Ornithobacterium rhinotracheale]